MQLELHGFENFIITVLCLHQEMCKYRLRHFVFNWQDKEIQVSLMNQQGRTKCKHSEL